MTTGDKKYILYWRDGTKTEIEGETISKAFHKHCGQGAIAALDFFVTVNPETGKPNSEWQWDDVEHDWVVVAKPTHDAGREQ